MKRFNRAWWENHFRYQSWKYICLAIWAVFGVSLVFGVTAYRVPPERRVDVYFVGPFADPDAVIEMAKSIREDLPHIEEVNCYTIPLTGDDESVSTNWQRLYVYIGAGEGDIFIFPKQTFFEYADQGAFMPLEGYVEEGALRLNEDMSIVNAKVLWDDEVGEHSIGVPLATQYGLFGNESFDNRNVIMGVMGYSKNPTQSVEVMQWIIDNRTEPMPDIFRPVPSSTPKPAN